jgi:hypothetical protein
MQRFLTHLSVAVLLLASASFAFAQRTTKSYFGTYNGAPCTAQLAWHNWAGLGPVDGSIKLASGATISVSGSNSQTGVLDLTVNGKAIRLVRSSAGRKAAWVSPTLSLTEGAGPTPTPSPSPSPSLTPSPVGTEDLLVDKTYTGTWNGKPITSQIRWVPGDTPAVLRRGYGKVTLEDGTQVAIEGWQPSADSMEFSLTPDKVGGEVYKTTKAIKGEGEAAWESSSLTLIEKK